MVNVAGRLNDKIASSETYAHKASVSLVTHQFTTGSRKMRSQFDYLLSLNAGISLAFHRMNVPFAIANIIVSPPSLAANILAYPALELLVGRGQSPLPDRDVPARLEGVNRILYGFSIGARTFEKMSQHGLLGEFFEALPLRWSSKYEASGHIKLATACIIAATAGRTLLQIPRIFACAWAAAASIAYGLCGAAVLFIFERSLQAIRKGVDTISPPTEHLGWARRVLNQSADLFALPAGIFLPTMEELFPYQQPGPAEQIVNLSSAHGQIAKMADAAIIRRFFHVAAEDAADHAQVRQIADSIVDDLRGYCARFPDDSYLRGGIHRVQAFMDMTYEEAEWVARPQTQPSSGRINA